ncbi:hypothetical protein E3N88_01730 [Mikania micrantha]|uniref:Very-long-chain (3R)-3-hydroxyacyl-CoA dehydratase n=1 Tax=Mikania micrantha TaxID=192012 RepID=A0A5N6Q1S3_9ASTR|nr:hypothetical protein E3N88_01730 [Mikania micrantha]
MAGFFSILRRFYLTAYNWIVFAGWQVPSIVLGFENSKGIRVTNFSYTASNKFKIVFGVGVLYSFPEVQTHPLISSLVISWCITEIVRYSFFGTKEAFGSTPYWLLWLRYSTFLVLYPTGIASEIAMIYNALPFMKESGLYSVRMPNKWNFSFDYYYCALVVLAVYVPGIPHLYGYMLGQRKKTLMKPKKE